ncbi:MAG: metalloregulator ArsR/SmtB family transcription factor [Acidimicrobiales bacterium]
MVAVLEVGSSGVSETFRALGDPVRASIVEHLSTRGDATVNELAALFPISLQAVSKHIKVLESAGVVTQRRDGRHRPVHLEPRRVAAATAWLVGRTSELDARLARLDDVLARLQEDDRS